MVARKKVVELSNNLDGTGNKMCLHTNSFDGKARTLGENIVIRINDGDVLVVMLYHCSKLESTVWLDVGTSE